MKNSARGSRNDELLKKLEQQISELRKTMGNRLDNELRQITDCLTLLKESHENTNSHGSPKAVVGKAFIKTTPKTKGTRKHKELVI
jgi:hypothetical protein